MRGPSSLNPSLDCAARRALAADAPLTLVHAVPGAGPMPPGTDHAAVVTEGRLLLQAEATRLSIKFPPLRVATHLHCGDIVHALVGLSADAALLVLGADRADALTGVLQGSVAVEVASGSLAPVLIIPAGYRDSSERNGVGTGHVVVGVDGSAESYAALTRAAAEAHRSGAALRVVAAVKPAAPVSENLTVSTSAMLLATRTSYPLLVVSWIVDILRTPARALIRHSRDGALLVIGRHGRGARAGVGLGSVTHALLLRPPCPTLIIPPSQPEPESGPDATTQAEQALGAARRVPQPSRGTPVG